MADLAGLLGQRSTPARENTQQGHEFAVPDDGRWAQSLRVAESYNGGMPSTFDPAFVQTMPSRAAPRVSLAVSTDLKRWNYRYMFEKKGERSLGTSPIQLIAELDNRLDDMGDVLRHAFGITSELEDPSIPSQEMIYAVVRICARVDPADSAQRDAPTDAPPPTVPRLGAQNMMLEASRMVGNGQRIPLALDAACTVRYAWTDAAVQSTNAVGLFPGMIVGVKGRNGSGNRFVAQELLIPPALPHPASSRAELLSHQYDETKLNGAASRILVGAGPFTEPDNLHFTPWHSFATYVENVQPDVLLLMGPFLSASHPMVAAGTLDEMPATLFRQHIARRLTRLAERVPATTLILVPSTDDIFHPHHAYPQPFFDKAEPALGLPKRVRCLPNPSVFYINELAIGVTTADVLGDLRREELMQKVGAVHTSTDGQQRAPESSADARDPMMRLARHALGQRSFYPLFPPSSLSKLPLDLSHSRLCALEQITPDLLLLPSTRVKPFIRVVDSTLVVNPGPLASSAHDTPRPNSNGSFVRIQVAPMDRAALDQGAEDTELITHDLFGRAKIDLMQTM
ncbi:DNA-directed DNA polymerase alpha subunit pol12 [Malassezia vespertilionis]|uniref:DNA polymerase alpha subunit B n=1 Tax=Malassezia vespertilionis TaxID=2020962 RepID=A0A2N1JF10_9BASI|nr:DNA-directed DNA polymerase alpha subunit pol12 [Malassezia vespertilionis]PKI85147.1 Pol12p [Malassezia vespertilionis]WFD05841.1 DNA-directed DNA polymerase alpha subunit pol12 [Malassezia vespertilionis]